MTKDVLADLMVTRAANLQGRLDLKLTALQAHVSGKLLSMESVMLDLKGEIGRLRQAVDAQTKVLHETRPPAR